MGGYGTYKLGFQWPDLFGAAFTAVGPPVAPGYLNTLQLVENARWVPYLNWAGRTDALVPIALVQAQQRRFDQLGLRSSLWTYPGGHYDLAAGDRWEGARAALVGPVVQPDPRRVDYAFVPSADNRRLGLVHDHAYWVSGLRSRDGERGQIGAISSVPPPGPGRPGAPFGRAGEPVLERLTAWDGTSGPRPESVSGTGWDGLRTVPPGNRLRVQLDNVARARLDGRRAGLTGRRCLQVTIAGDGPARVRLDLRLPRGARARARQLLPGERAEGARDVALGRGGATIAAPRRHRRSWVDPPALLHRDAEGGAQLVAFLLCSHHERSERLQVGLDAPVQPSSSPAPVESTRSRIGATAT